VVFGGVTSMRSGLCSSLPAEVGDVVGEGCREQQVLTLGRQAGEDFLHVVDEAHVEHAVGFVQHEDFHVGQIDAALAAGRAGGRGRRPARQRRGTWPGTCGFMPTPPKMQALTNFRSRA
jgi:hypothetical protein